MFEEIPIPSWYFDPPKRKKTTAPPMNCPGCGRFTKYLSTRHHYNGTWDLVTSYHLCKKCGEVSVEHV